MKIRYDRKNWSGTVLLALMIALGVTAKAQAVLISLDGSSTLTDVGTLDWGPTSFAAAGGGAAIVNFAATGGTCPAVSCNFDVLTLARLVGTSDSGGNPNTPSGLNTTYEITMIARFTERVTGSTGASNSTFATVPGAAFFQFFYDTSIDAVDVSGSGFNDGRLILSGTSVGAAIGTFTVTSTTPVVIDQNGNNDYGPSNSPPGCVVGTDECTVRGSGSQSNISIGGLTLDPTFFPQQFLYGFQLTGISQGLPFIAFDDPADCYVPTASGVGVENSTVGAQPCDTDHVDGLMSANVAGATGFVPIIGNVNGVFTTAPDFITQIDFNTLITAVAVPEPMSMLLLGSGLIGISAVGRIRKRKSR